LLAGLATAPLALVVGLPALRTASTSRCSPCCGVALGAFLFSSGTFTGGANGRLIPAVKLFGIDFNIRSSDATAYPRPEFGLLVLVVAVLAGVLVAFCATAASAVRCSRSAQRTGGGRFRRQPRPHQALRIRGIGVHRRARRIDDRAPHGNLSGEHSRC
jgi:hypothetical protein